LRELSFQFQEIHPLSTLGAKAKTLSSDDKYVIKTRQEWHHKEYL